MACIPSGGITRAIFIPFAVTRRTAVIEFDRVDHREIIKSPKFLSLLVNELVTEKKLGEVKDKLLAEMTASGAPIEEEKPQTKEETAEEVAEMIFTQEQLLGEQ